MTTGRDFELPANLIEEIGKFDPPGGPRHTWLAGLPGMAATLADRWNLTLGRPYQPGGATAWVAPARTRDGERRAVKIGWRHDEAMHEADALRLWNGDGATYLYGSYATGDTAALLLEECLPGTTLTDSLPPLDQDVVIAGILRKLWISPTAGHPFRTLASMCDWWADEFDAKYAAGVERGDDVLDPVIARDGIMLFRELPENAPTEALLCTDLHGGNILAAEREPWLAIDPKPYVGDRTYDALQHMYNHPRRLAEAPREFARRMANLLDLDADRLLLWLFARCVQESLDEPILKDVAVELALS